MKSRRDQSFPRALTYDLCPRFLPLCLAIALLLPGLLTSSGQTSPATKEPVLRAGAATSNISPWLGLSINGNMRDVLVRHVHDELHARCLVLDNGNSRIAFVVVDSCMIPLEVIERAKDRISKRTSLPPENVIISATHTHSAPAATAVFQTDPDPEYQRFLAVRIADAVELAINKMAPARVAWGSGSVPQHVFNRRWHMKPGTVLADPFGGTNDLVKTNPGIGNPDLLDPAGPIDPELVILAVQTQTGKPLALLANYSLHYCGGVGSGQASADYFGAFSDRLQELLNADRQDPAFVGMMSNGTSGDINNINFRGGQPEYGPYERIRTVANDVAEEAARVYRSLEFHEWIPLSSHEKKLSLGVRLPTATDLAYAREVIAQAQSAEMKSLPEVYARETVLLSEYPSQVPVILQAHRVGQLTIAAIPCEVFVEIGLELKKAAPFNKHMTISLANGYNGYLPTEKHHQLGGYETWRARSSYLEHQAASKITQTLMELLRQVEQDEK